MNSTRSWTNDLDEARQRVAALGASLPPLVDVAALGVKSKAPYNLLSAREALIWRTEELARNACDALEKGDYAAAGLLTRAVAESAALTWYLLKILQTRAHRTTEQLNDVLWRVATGSKKWKDVSEAVNILTCVERIDRTLPGFRNTYDSLSEFAHPN